MTVWSFVHINDTQPGSPRSYRYRPALMDNEATAYAQIRRLAPELVLVGGDLTRDGTLHDFEFQEAKSRLDALNLPYHTIPGNMDVGNKPSTVPGGTGRDDPALTVTDDALRRFERCFGPFPWTFVHRNVRFTGFYAAVAGTGLPQEQRLWRFLDDLPHQPATRHHVVVMHYALFVDRLDEPNFDLTLREQYNDWYFCIDHPHRDRIFEQLQRANVDIVLSGHIHCRRPVQVVDGIRFYKTAAVSFGQWGDRWPDGDTTLGFYRFHVTDDDVRDEFIPLESVSQRTDGYGPGGHPRPEQRDYSQAWVQ